MRVWVFGDDHNVIFDFDDRDRDAAAYPADQKVRAALTRALTEALKFLLFKKRGGLDNEV